MKLDCLRKVLIVNKLNDGAFRGDVAAACGKIAS